MLNTPGDRCAVNVLLTALEESVPQDLAQAPTATPLTLLRARLVQCLIEHRALEATAALWAVDTWAGALGHQVPREQVERVALAHLPAHSTRPEGWNLAPGLRCAASAGLGALGELAVVGALLVGQMQPAPVPELVMMPAATGTPMPAIAATAVPYPAASASADYEAQTCTLDGRLYNPFTWTWMDNGAPMDWGAVIRATLE
jgi:hypothetical protein